MSVAVTSARGQSLEMKGLKVCHRAGSRADGWSLKGSSLKSPPGLIQREIDQMVSRQKSVVEGGSETLRNVSNENLSST